MKENLVHASDSKEAATKRNRDLDRRSLKMKILDIYIEGKTKIVYNTEEADKAIIKYKDDNSFQGRRRTYSRKGQDKQQNSYQDIQLP